MISFLIIRLVGVPLMTSEERLDYFLAEVARGTVREFLDAPVLDLRRGVLAAIVVNQLVEFIHDGRPDLRDHPTEKASAFRARLVGSYPDLSLLRDVADATKHPVLDRKKPVPGIPGIESVRTPDPQVFDRNGEPIFTRSGEPLFARAAVVVHAQDGRRHLIDIVMGCFAMLEEMIARPQPVR
jgi:hypothetical protein